MNAELRALREEREAREKRRRLDAPAAAHAAAAETPKEYEAPSHIDAAITRMLNPKPSEKITPRDDPLHDIWLSGVEDSPPNAKVLLPAHLPASPRARLAGYSFGWLGGSGLARCGVVFCAAVLRRGAP